MKNAEWCGMGKGAGNRFPEQLRVKAPPRFHETPLGGIGVQVQHDFNAQAIAPAIPPIEVADRCVWHRSKFFLDNGAKVVDCLASKPLKHQYGTSWLRRISS